MTNESERNEGGQEQRRNTIEKMREKLRATGEKVSRLQEQQAADRRELATQIVDMEEGNTRLNWEVSQDSQRGKGGYRQGLEAKNQELQELTREMQQGREALVELRREREKIKKEAGKESSIQIDLPTEEDLQGLEEAIEEGGNTIEKLQEEYQELRERYLTFEKEGEKYAQNPLKTATEQVIWAHEQRSGSTVSKEERTAIEEETTKEKKRRLEEQEEKRKEEQGREFREQQEKELSALEERLNGVRALFDAKRASMFQAIEVMQKELNDEAFLAGIEKQRKAIKSNQVLIEGGVWRRMAAFRQKHTAALIFYETFSKYFEEYSQRYRKAGNVNREAAEFIEGQISHFEQARNLYSILQREKTYYSGPGNEEINAGFQKLFNATKGLVSEMQYFKTEVGKNVAEYSKKLEETFHGRELGEMKVFRDRFLR